MVVSRPLVDDYNTGVIRRQTGELRQLVPLVLTGDWTFGNMNEIRNTIILSGAVVLLVTLPVPTAGVDDGVRIVLTADTGSTEHVVTADALTLTWPAAADDAGIELVAFNGDYEVISNSGIVIS